MEKKILILDDDQAIRDMMTTAFEKLGYSVTATESGEEALDLLNHTIRVMFVDLNLPGINGIEFCRRVRRNDPLTVIYAVTGYASLFELADCREAGFDDYFTKPVKLETLFLAAQQAFDRIDRWKKREKC